MDKFILRLVFFLFISLPVLAEQDNCEQEVIPLPGDELVETMEAVADHLYKDISKLKVNHDGEGKLSVFYENGRPMLLKLYYKNEKGTMLKEISFADLEKGETLIFENSDKPGKALVFRRGDNFQKGNNYSFKLSVRTSIDPDKYRSYDVTFHSDEKKPEVSASQKKFKEIVVSPGISWLSWDGTFQKVEFTN